MASFITNYIQNTAMGMLSSGITAAGNVAGNAVGGVGTVIQNSGQAVGSGIEGSIKNWGDYINSYGDRAIAATAPNPGSAPTAVKKQKALPAPAKGAGAVAKQKALPAAPSSAQKALPAAPSSAQKALPAPASKPKTLGANTPSYAGAVKGTAVSAASKPKSAIGGGSPVPSVGGLPKPSVPKPSVSSLAPVNSKPLGTSTASLPPVNSKPLGSSTAGKVRISPASKPKTSGGLPKAPVDGLSKLPGVSGVTKAPAAAANGLPKLPGVSGVTKAPAAAANGLPKVTSLPPANMPKPPSSGKVRIDPASKPKKY